jgi:hypothetical protein
MRLLRQEPRRTVVLITDDNNCTETCPPDTAVATARRPWRSCAAPGVSKCCLTHVQDNGGPGVQEGTLSNGDYLSIGARHERMPLTPSLTTWSTCNLPATLARIHGSTYTISNPHTVRLSSSNGNPTSGRHRHPLTGGCWASDNTLLICLLEYSRLEQKAEGWSRLPTPCGYIPVVPPSIHGCINAS